MISFPDFPEPILLPEFSAEGALYEGIDPRDESESPPHLVVIANNLACLGIHPENAVFFCGHPEIQTQLELAAQYARVAEYAQAQVRWSLDRVAWMGVIAAIGPLQAPYLNAVLHVLETSPFMESADYD